jgi:uncharacterized membrane protein YcaP (DUF421 family)
MFSAVVMSVRIFGKRSTSRMINFDWIVTVAIGTLMASGVLLADVTIIKGAAAIYALLILQWALTKIMINSDIATTSVKSEPTLLLHRGQLLAGAMHKERLNEAEIPAAIRAAGYSRVQDVQWVILETNS